MPKSETAVFGGGCFWGVQSAFDQIAGVVKTTAGYSGGHSQYPDYKQVCTGLTGHAEVVKVVFDPNVVTYEKLLDTFFKIHDPTQVNQQGHDIGPQYRSAIFVTSLLQSHTAIGKIESLRQGNIYPAPIATTVERLDKFWPAEDYHQHYFKKNPDAESCSIKL